ncbi:mechanosensitive ion channel family protein [Rhizobium oryzicola]|uniref:Mechanosensitive ion channel family protein n=1 Tax=Rhizobium oryzicola TaxID=1232668 RepID=A0ABT8T2M5_9HYPH|nr:mechanosensitive ion channel family protein [Rhizobium oryzicola]MDO1584393.1 mechanosensitive ion channel family protein [Rhizobium oryzicola]
MEASGLQKTQALLTEVRKQLDRMQANANASNAEDFQLAELKAQADDLAGQVDKSIAELRQRVEQIQARLKEIGEPPAQGQPPEATVVTEERKKLQSEKAAITASVTEASQVSTAVKTLSNNITEKRRRLFSDTLLKHTELSPAVFADAGQAFLDEVEAFRITIAGWAKFAWKFKKLSLLAALILSVGSGLLFLAGGHRLFGRLMKRNLADENPLYTARLSYAFWSMIVETLSLTAFLITTFFFLLSFNVLRPDVTPIVGAIFGFIWLVYFVEKLTEALLSPRYPAWRLMRLSNSGAKELRWFVLSLAVLNGLDFVLGRISESLNSPVSITIVKSLTLAVLQGSILIAISFLKPVMNDNKDPEAPGRHWPRFFPSLLRVMGIALIFAVMTGYVGLARFFSTQIVLTGAVIVTMYIGILSGKSVGKQGAFAKTVAGRFLVERHKLGEVTLDQIGLAAGLGIYAVAFIFGVPLILLTWGFQIQDIQSAAYRLFTQISIGNINISLVGILVGVLFFLAGYVVTRWTQGWIDRNVMARSQVDPGVRNSVKTGIGYLGVGFAVVVGVSAAGINLSSLALVASALSVGIGFGLQNIVSNFVSGLILLVERPFKVGDHVVTGATEGIVKRISVRATEIETFRKQSIIVPNSDLINAAVGNWTHRNRIQRSEVQVSVSYDSDPQRVMDLLLDIINQVPQVLRNPEPHVEFLRFGGSSLDFEMRFHLADMSDGMTVRNNVRIEILKRFREEGIEIPYPHQDVNISGPIRAMLVPREPETPKERAAEAPASAPKTEPKPDAKPA